MDFLHVRNTSEQAADAHHPSLSHHRQHTSTTHSQAGPSNSQSSSSNSNVDLVPQWETISTANTSAAKKPRAKPSTDRTPGQSLIPASKVESILSADADYSALSKEAIYVLTVATEEFIKRLTYTSYVRADVERRAITGYNDVAESADKFAEFRFLKDTIPLPVPLAAALNARKTIDDQREAYLDEVAEEAHHETHEPAPVPSGSGVVQEQVRRAKRPRASNPSPSRPINAEAEADGPGPSIRSERLKNKRAKLGHEADGSSVSSGPTRASRGKGKGKVDPGPVLNGNDCLESTSYKIKIRPRLSQAPPETPSEQKNNVGTNATAILRLVDDDKKEPLRANDVKSLPSESVASAELNAVTNGSRSQKANGTPPKPGSDPSKSKVKGTNGLALIPGAPAEAPLWTRVPRVLPPPPSLSTKGTSDNGGQGQAQGSPRSSPTQSSKQQQHQKQRHAHPKGAHASQKPASDATRHPDVDTADVSPDFRSALSPTAPNPGRTIYSQ